MKIKWKCAVCGKELKIFSMKDYVFAPKTTVFGEFKIRDLYGNMQTIDRRTDCPVCSRKCKQKNEEQYFIEEYKGTNIYCVNGRYMFDLECDYWYDSIEGVKQRIDNPHLIPVTPQLMSELHAAIRGELGNI